MVTAEYAVAIPAILAVLALVLSALTYVSAQGDACHAARVYARERSVGSSDAAAQSLADRSVPGTVTVSAAESGHLITVSAAAQYRFASLAPATCSVTVRAERSVH